MNLYITFLRTACSVFTPELTNSSLARVHLGLFKSILKASLYATCSFWRLAFLYFNHRCAVYIGEQYALNRVSFTPTVHQPNLRANTFAHTYNKRHWRKISSSSVSWSVITWLRYFTSLQIFRTLPESLKSGKVMSIFHGSANHYHTFWLVLYIMLFPIHRTHIKELLYTSWTRTKDHTIISVHKMVHHCTANHTASFTWA